MAEEFDALQISDPLTSLGLALAVLLLGILLEAGLRFAQRWVAARNKPLAGLVLGALCWQPLFWSILIAAAGLLTGLSDVSVARQRGLDLVWGLLIISLTIIVVRILAGWFKMRVAPRDEASISILNYLINGLAVVVVLIVALYAFSVPMTLQLVTLGGSALGLSLALREPLANLFAGIVLTASDRLRPGEFVQLPSGKEGYILDIGWDVTSIQQLRNSLIIVPNSAMNQAEIINLDRLDQGFEIEVNIGVSYDSDLAEVERVTVEVAEGVLRELGGGSPASPPYVEYQDFRDSDILFTVYLTCPVADRFQVRHAFLKRLHLRYQEEGIEIPRPGRILSTQPDEPLRVVLGDPEDAPARAVGVQATPAKEGNGEVPGV